MAQSNAYETFVVTTMTLFAPRMLLSLRRKYYSTIAGADVHNSTMSPLAFQSPRARIDEQKGKSTSRKLSTLDKSSDMGEARIEVGSEMEIELVPKVEASHFHTGDRTVMMATASELGGQEIAIDDLF